MTIVHNCQIFNPSGFKILEHLKWQRGKLQHTLIINRMVLCVCVDANVVIVIDIFIVNVLGVNDHLHWENGWMFLWMFVVLTSWLLQIHILSMRNYPSELYVFARSIRGHEVEELCRGSLEAVSSLYPALCNLQRISELRGVEELFSRSESTLMLES